MEAAAPRTVLDILRLSAARHPAELAVLSTTPGESLTYSALLNEVLRVANALRQRGVRQSDAVLVSLPNGPAMLTAILGTMSAALCAPMNPAYTLGELERLAEDIGAVAVVTSTDSPTASAELAQRRDLELVHVDEIGETLETATIEPRAETPALLLHTAGTTARPKQVPLSHANLVAAASNVVNSLQLTPADRCLNVMPLFHSHGLLGAAMSSLLAGSGIVCTPGMDPRRFLEWAAEFGCTWYTAAPTIHQLVLRAPGDWDGFRFMRSASAPLPPQIAAGLEARYGAPMIEVYGMTEAYQIAANPLPPGERRLGTVGKATGTEIAVLGSDGLPRLSGGGGEVLVRGPAAFRGYSSPVEANNEAFVQGWFRTGDVGTISDDGYLTITGRVKEQINRGGEKVSPREVEEALLDHPGITEVIAFAIPDDQLGEEIGVAIVPAPGATIDLATVRSFLIDRVAPFKMPRRVLVVDEIPKSDTGKPQRIAFARDHAEELTRDPAATRVDLADDASTLERLGALWMEVLDLEQLPAPSDHFFNLGGTSLAVMELVIRIENDFGIDLPVLDVLEVPTLAGLAVRLDQQADGAVTTPLLRRYRRGSGDASIILIPGQVGMAVGLNLIADAISADVNVYLFDYPGHRAGQEPLTSVDALSDVLVAEVQAAGIARQLALYGNSMGSWVAFEAARSLRAMGWPPLFVGIGDMYSPYFNTKESPLRPPLVRRLCNRLRRELQRHRRRRIRQDPRAPTALKRQQNVSDASEIARRSYTPRPYEGDLMVVVASERAPKFGATLGYERHTSGTITTLQVAGGHSKMHHEQAQPIGAALSEMLFAHVRSQPDHD